METVSFFKRMRARVWAFLQGRKRTQAWRDMWRSI